MQNRPSLVLALHSTLLFPAYVWQGLALRRRSLRLSPPGGQASGVIAGEGNPVRLLVIGDSSAAGVGVTGFEDTLCGQLAPLLASLSGRPVVWRVAGFNSATSGQIRDHALPHIEPRDFTHIVLAIGTNDAKNWHGGGRFKREFGGLIYALKARFPAARIVWSPPVDMRDVPLLPALLGRILEMRALLICRIGEQLCYERGAIAAPRLHVFGPEGFAEDGFHAGPSGYRAWAEHVAPILLGLNADGSTPQP